VINHAFSFSAPIEQVASTVISISTIRGIPEFVPTDVLSQPVSCGYPAPPANNSLPPLVLSYRYVVQKDHCG